MEKRSTFAPQFGRKATIFEQIKRQQAQGVKKNEGGQLFIIGSPRKEIAGRTWSIEIN